MENAAPLKAAVRTDFGKGPSRRLRQSGQIPAVCYGDNESVHLIVDPSELVDRLKGNFGLNAIFKLEVEGGTDKVVRVVDFQRDPVRREFTHVDFSVIDPEREIEVKVPIVLTGKAAGVAAGGKFRQVRRDVKIRAKAPSIPANLELDVTTLGGGDVKRVKEIVVPDGVELIFDQNFAVASVSKPRGGAVVKEEE